mmetsp:Transcript_17401/g.30315  ORF Transcript_17401/g.30315 Transcript_17401/m.30315 type:complete len:178 (+) Transcript_17401:228-761(+)
MGLLSEIENNKVTSLHLTDMPKKSFEGAKVEDFCTALEKNTSITTVHMKDDFLACLRGDQRSQVVKAVGKLPAVTEIYFGGSLLLAPDLTSVVETAKTLKVLHLHDVCLQGAPELCKDFEKALSAHSALKEFDMKDCMTANASVDLEAVVAAGKKSSCGGGVDPAVITPGAATAGTA